MHLEPVEIQHVKLRRRLLGYEPEAVDRLLENVTASYEDVWFERRTLESELASLRNKLDGQAMAKEALQGSVQVAQSTADDLLAEAHVRAREVLDEANAKAAETVRDAQAEYQRLRVEIKKLEVSETEITLRLRSLLTAARELLDGHESIRRLASETPDGDTSTIEAAEPPAHDRAEADEADRMDETLQQQAARTVAAPEPRDVPEPPAAEPPAAEPPAAQAPAAEPPVAEATPATAPPLETDSQPSVAPSAPSAPVAVAAVAAALTATREGNEPAPVDPEPDGESTPPVEAPPEQLAPDKGETSEARRVGPDPAVTSRAAL